MLRSRDMLKSL